MRIFRRNKRYTHTRKNDGINYNHEILLPLLSHRAMKKPT